ncbi:hypothetical protein X949_5856 [Burkholderia pseudomallei MSHR5609]|nr:hypothetical protein X949_5856 [Burkholderia pseudomallei MSHR5609]KGX50673.1 hypothetical protein Y024_5880 [Burkholderia pseudomallei TSV44]
MWRKSPTRKRRFQQVFQARVRAFSFLFANVATYIRFKPVPRKLGMKDQGFIRLQRARLCPRRLAASKTDFRPGRSVLLIVGDSG